MDILSPEQRSEVMRRICGKDTQPEMVVRRFIYGLGFRYRLHVRDLPGRPDIVLRSRRKVIFVNGCFWHRHPGCPFAYMPKARREFWMKKLSGNRRRDARNLRALESLGWHIFTVWECEVEAQTDWTKCLKRFLKQSSELCHRGHR